MVCVVLCCHGNGCVGVGKSTDVELLDLMLELAQTPVAMGTQSSQTLYQTPSIGHSLSRRLRRTLSMTGSSEDVSLSRSQPVCDTGKTGLLETSLTASQPVLKAGSPHMEENDDVMETDEVDKFLVMGETLLNRSDRTSLTGKTSQTSIPETENGSTVQVESTKCSSSPLLLTPPQILPDNSFSSPQNSVFSDNDLFDNDFPLDPPLTLSPPREVGGSTGDTNPIQDLDPILDGENEPVKNLSIMLNSSAAGPCDKTEDDIEDGHLLDSQFDIPCAQPPSSRETPLDAESSQQRTKNDSILSSSDREMMSSDGGKSSDDVQLEFEMPEITISQFEAFQSPAAEILGTPSKMASSKYSLGKGLSRDAEGLSRDAVIINPRLSSPQPLLSGTEGENANSGLKQGMDQDGVKDKITQGEKRTSTPFKNADQPLTEDTEMTDVATISPNYLSSSQRRRLLLELCSGNTDDLMSSEDEGGGVHLCESESEEEEEEWRSGQWTVAPDTLPERSESCQNFTYLKF